MSVKLEAGQWYRTRANQIAKCIHMHPRRGHLLVFGDGSCGYYPPDQAVEHLPDCTGFDWVPAPKLQLREGAWYERKDGKIVGPCEVDREQPNDHGYKWTATPWRYRDDGSNLVTEDQWLVREVEPPQPPQPKYRPFKDGAEFKPFRDKWVKYKQSDVGKTMLCVSFSNEGVTACVSFMPYKTAFDSLVFEDGSPFGVTDAS
jgi:hypothetical protein